MSFQSIQIALQESFNALVQDKKLLYEVDVTKEEMWEAYLSSFPEETRQSYNCNCCRSFINNIGRVVVLENNTTRSIWEKSPRPDVTASFKALDRLIKSKPIKDVYVSSLPKIGVEKNNQLLEEKVITWYHLFLKLPTTLVQRGSKSEDTIKSEFRSIHQVLKRGLDEITPDALDTVLELVEQNSLYRGAEFKESLVKFKTLQEQYFKVPIKNRQKENFIWSLLSSNPVFLTLRNSAIGTLLVDLSTGVDLEKAVSSFEKIMAPANYKRPTALITAKQISDAEKYLEERGMINSLGRRLATEYDIKPSYTLFLDRDKKSVKGILGALKETLPVNIKSFSKVESMSMSDFISKVLPTATNLEVFFNPSHKGNLVSLIGPQDPEAPTMFKWNNAFSWSYAEGTADSIKEKVKAAGGNVEGSLRISLSWHNYDDLDLHVQTPTSHIAFHNAVDYVSRGRLDVDMNAGFGKTRSAVENVSWPISNPPHDGEYHVWVNNYSKRESIDVGFTVQIEKNGELTEFHFDRSPSENANTVVCKFKIVKGSIVFLTKEGGASSVVSHDIWNIATNKFHPVSMFMRSPSHWGPKVGNEHYFFMIKGAKAEGNIRGFFNEFLQEDLLANKRVFEALGSRTKVDLSVDNQLSGLGFSSTQSNEVYCKVTGKTERVIKIQL